MIAQVVQAARASRKEARIRIPVFGDISRGHLLAATAVFLVILLGPVFLSPIFLMKFLCYAIFAAAYNLLIGYTGLVSFGHAAYFGIGSYIAAWAMKDWGVTPEVAVLLSAASSGALGLVFGSIAIRRQGLYFAMITLALAQMVYFICVQMPYTGGEDGISSIPRGHLFGLISLDSDLTMYFALAVLLMLSFAFLYRVVYSPFGYVLRSIRDNESRATSLGFKTDQYKLTAFVISASFAGLAGGAKAIAFGIATLTDVDFNTSGEVVLMTLLGGLGTIFGPLAGSFVLTSMQTYLAELGSWVTVVQGATFMICILIFRRGLIGELQRKLKFKG